MNRDALPDMTARLLGEEPPAPLGLRRAAVCVMLAGGDSPKTLLIKRAERDGDPWSGQVAFPGGKAQDGDLTAKDTAVREAREEVGIDPGGAGRFMGYMSPFRTHTGTMEVVPAVFTLPREVAAVPNLEVSSYKWVELSRLTEPDAASQYRLERPEGVLELPAFRVDDYLVWGLTHRILHTLLSGRP